jgi:hypothetical protein
MKQCLIHHKRIENLPRNDKVSLVHDRKEKEKLVNIKTDVEMITRNFRINLLKLI